MCSNACVLGEHQVLLPGCSHTHASWTGWTRCSQCAPAPGVGPSLHPLGGLSWVLLLSYPQTVHSWAYCSCVLPPLQQPADVERLLNNALYTQSDQELEMKVMLYTYLHAL